MKKHTLFLTLLVTSHNLLNAADEGGYLPPKTSTALELLKEIKTKREALDANGNYPTNLAVLDGRILEATETFLKQAGKVKKPISEETSLRFQEQQYRIATLEGLRNALLKKLGLN